MSDRELAYSRYCVEHWTSKEVWEIVSFHISLSEAVDAFRTAVVNEDAQFRLTCPEFHRDAVGNYRRAKELD